MTLFEIEKKYNELIGPIPMMIMLGRSEEEQKKILLDAIKTGKKPQLIDFVPPGAIV